MIKRYSFGVKSSHYDDPFESKIVIDQIEAEDGDWVKWEDVAVALDELTILADDAVTKASCSRVVAGRVWRSLMDAAGEG